MVQWSLQKPYDLRVNHQGESNSIFSGLILYTLLQKKCNFSEPIFPGDPGSLTVTPGHVHFVKWFLE